MNRLLEIAPQVRNWIDESDLNRVESSIFLGDFSVDKWQESDFWNELGLPSPPQFLTGIHSIPDAVSVANGDKLLILLKNDLRADDRSQLIKHCLGHFLLGHLRPGDNTAHYDFLSDLKEGRGLRHWDAQVAEFYSDKTPDLSETFQTKGLDEVWERIIFQQTDPQWLSAARLHNDFKEEIVDVANNLAEKARLFPHQIRGVAESVTRLRRFNTAILADSVGLGKTRTSCAVIRTLLDHNSITKAAVIAPRKLERNWRNEFDVVGLKESHDVFLINKDVFKRQSPQEAARVLQGFGLIVVEEAHQDLRNPGNRFHRNLRDAAGLAKGLMVTATPWNNRRGDIFAILSPFVRPAPSTSNNGVFDCFRKGFRTGRKEFEESDDIFQRVYSLTVLQRTRKQLREVGNSGVFYALRDPKLDTADYSKEAQAAFRSLLGVVESLRLPYFNPIRYLTAETDSEWRLSGTHRFFLLKRAESSMAAFRLTLQGMRLRAKELQEKLKDVKESEDEVARWLASHYKISEELVEGMLDFDPEELRLLQESITRPRQKRALRLIDEARIKGKLRPLRSRLLKECDSDIKLLDQVEDDFASLFENDPKLSAIVSLVRKYVASGEKVLLVSQFADTAYTVYRTMLNDQHIAAGGVGLVMSSSKSGDAPIQINGRPATRDNALRRFAPRAWAQNEAEAGRASQKRLLDEEGELNVLIGTDTLSVGQNLQDARVLIHLDLTWNPMVLEQRIGRLDRPRHESDNAPIQILYLLNLDLIEAELKLKKMIDQRLEATYRDTAFDDEILPGYFDLIETMRKLRAKNANAQEIAFEVDELLEKLNSAKPSDVVDIGVEARRDALDRLRVEVSRHELPDPLPPLVVTLGKSTNGTAEIAAQLEFQAYDNNEREIGTPFTHLLSVEGGANGASAVCKLDDLPRAIEIMLQPESQKADGAEIAAALQTFDREAQRVASDLRDERNRLREKRREIRERIRPSWLAPLIQQVRSFLEKLSEKKYEDFLKRYQLTDEQLGLWLDTLTAGVDLDNREMVERLRRLQTSPAAILDEFGDIREIVSESEQITNDDQISAQPELSFDNEPHVQRLSAQLVNIRVNLPR
jgi:superfamily II DNA or RNA helicase